MHRISIVAKNFFTSIDWVIVLSIIPLVAAGLVTMHSFTGDNSFFDRQILWAAVSFCAFLAFSFFDFRFLRRSHVLVGLFLGVCTMLVYLLVLGNPIKGARSWLDLGFLSFQPTDPAKIVIILLLAKYFSQRHIEIKHIRHILVSGIYAGIITLLVLLQPDFGSAIILFSIWFGMVFISGISKKHLALVFVTIAVVFAGLWLFGFQEYQKQRIMTFIHPLADVQGAGYNAYQSTIAIGSGQLLGKGIGFGTQSRLQFLPEHETDFIFAAFAEEWGFIGSMLVLVVFGIIIWRILATARYGATNFETLFAFGVAILFASHVFVHVGMNIGLMPITGTPMPFMSYGGSHLLTEFIALGMLMGMRRYSRVTTVRHRLQEPM